jgi:hypothetical protein
MAARTRICKLFAPKPRTIGKDLFRFWPRLEALADRTLLSNPATSVLNNDIVAANSAPADTATTITLTAGSTFDFTSATNATQNALPVITANITIVGNGDTIDRSTVTGTQVFRLFDVASGGSLKLENLTLTGGLAQGTGSAAEGGAGYSSATLTLSGVTVKNNQAQGSNGPAGGNGADAQGGGLFVATGNVTLSNDSLSSNKAHGGSGGGFAITDGSGSAGSGGGMYVAGWRRHFGGLIDSVVLLTTR